MFTDAFSDLIYRCHTPDNIRVAGLKLVYGDDMKEPGPAPTDMGGLVYLAELRGVRRIVILVRGTDE